MYRGRLVDTLRVQICLCVYADSVVILHRVGRRLGWSTAYPRASMSSSQAEGLSLCGFGGCWLWGQSKERVRIAGKGLVTPNSHLNLK